MWVRRGFTLIELCIAMAVLAVLAGLALPGFLDAIRKARRSDAFDALARLQQAQERHRSTHSEFAASLPALGLGALSSAGHYRLAVDAAGPTHFTLSARALGRQAADRECALLSVSVTRGNLNRTARSADGSDRSERCWPQ